ncbi:MAG: hypothetical protein K2G14_02245 [Ruminococcus sp.]|nr:hypothetical protein [Ruminococcus sp.]
MTAKEYLKQLQNIQLRINSLQKSIQLCQERAVGTGTRFSDISAAQGNRNKIADNMAKKVDFESELMQLTDEFEKFRLRVIRQINCIPDNRYVSLLMNKYVNNMSWERVTEEIGEKNSEYVRKELHEKALKKFSEIIPENLRKSPKISLYSD